MRACLALQGNENSLIHFKREKVEGKWGEPLIIEEGNEPYPYRAQYKIRFMLRIKFYGDFAYLDIGQKWAPGEDPTDTIYVEPAQLEVVNRCMLSEADAQTILNNYILGAELTVNGSKAVFAQIGKEKYSVTDGNVTIEQLTSGPIAEALAALEKERLATYVTDDNAVLSDGETLLTIE
jgi:hypothetical protein